MALKKSQLYSSLWQSCDELRGGMDASQYKDYVLTLLFMKYVSDKHAGKPDTLIEVPQGGGFADMAKLIGDKEIGDKLNKIIGKLAEANDLQGVIDQADFNDDSKLGRGKEMQDRLSKLVAIFNGLDFQANRAEGDDLLGDAYEYLMRHFATDSGKSKGQFYTPAEVSRVMAQVIGLGADTRQDQTIYDPACGSGSLLLRGADQAPHGITIYGQEMDNATWALARMNLILHGHPTADLWRGNTLAAPHFKNANGGLRTFDFAIANPPFSSKAWSTGLDPANDEFGRFEYGIPPPRNGDYAFFLHMITSLKSKGKGAIILPHGVLFRGKKEAGIRRNLVRRGFIKCIIGLPANLFYGTPIPACIMVLDKENAHARTGIFMIDASKGFIKDGAKNRLREQDIHRIVDVFTRQTEVARYARMVPAAEIASPANDFNLNIPRYIDSSEPEDLHDLEAHLKGGIPNRDIENLQACWAVFPSLRNELFAPSGRAGYSVLRLDPNEVKAAILEHEEFRSYAGKVRNALAGWCQAHEKRLLSINAATAPKSLIADLSVDILGRFSDLPLLDAYDVYQRLRDYWEEAMQDDIYLIVGEGWRQAARPRRIVQDRKSNLKEMPDLVVKRRKYKLDLIPPALVIARYFKHEQRAIQNLEHARNSAAQELAEFIEEHTGEEGLLNDAASDRNKITKASATARLRAIRDADASDDERQTLEQCLSLVEAESKASKAVKAAQAALDSQVLDRYAKLSKDEIKTLVVQDKWLTNIRAAIETEVHHLTQSLAARIQQIEERYARPLPELEQDVEAFSRKVEQHLAQMGVAP